LGLGWKVLTRTNTEADFASASVTKDKRFETLDSQVFYRGYVPNILGILPYAGIDLTVYEVSTLEI